MNIKEKLNAFRVKYFTAEKEKKRLKTISCGCEEHKVKIPTQFVGKTGNLMVKKDALEKIQEFKNKKICSKCYTFYIFKEEVIYE
jgi:hypothetical protein